MAATAHLPWWLAADDESCPGCLQGYAWEVEVRCAACDRPACPQCAAETLPEPDRLCPGCAAEEEA